MSAVWPAQLTAQANVCMPAPAVLVIAYGYTELSQVYLDTQCNKIERFTERMIRSVKRSILLQIIQQSEFNQTIWFSDNVLRHAILHNQVFTVCPMHQ